MHLASFRYKASLEQIDYSIERGLDRNQMHRLAGLDFVKEHKDLFITGSTGTGKSFLAMALGYQACQEGYRIMYVNTAKLMGQLKLAKAKGTILAELKRIDLLILDDFGLQPFDSQGRGILLDIIEDRHQKRSTVITSQIPVKEWYDIIGEKNHRRRGAGPYRPPLAARGTVRRIVQKKKSKNGGRKCLPMTLSGPKDK